jgi:hypothetical protein
MQLAEKKIGGSEMDYKKIGGFMALLDAIEETVNKNGYTIREFEQVQPWGERSRSGKNIELRIAPIKEDEPDAIRDKKTT